MEYVTLFIQKVIRKFRSLFQLIPAKIKCRYIRKYYIKNEHRKNTGFQNDFANIAMINLTQELREKAIAENKQKYAQKPYRFLFHLPESGVGIVWFKDLIQILEHTGISCTSVAYDDPAFKTIWNEFQPNVFISVDMPKILEVLDLEFIRQYKKAHGCIRLFTPYPKYRFPKQEMSKEDRWRLELALAGKTADAYFCMYVDEYWKMFQSEWDQAGFKYLALPHACNPLYQYPREGQKKYDYFMATSYGPERVRVTWDYMKPIFQNYYGLWAGPDWGFGLGRIAADQLPQYYAESKIVPNPLASQLIKYPMEITERTFSAMASGAFQITDWTQVTNQFFMEDELVQVHGREEFLEKFDYYLKHTEERNTVLVKGIKRLYKDHTYFNRIDRLIAFLEPYSTDIN